MIKRNRIGIFSIINGCLLLLVAMTTLLPLLHVVSVSLSDRFAVLQNKVGLIPKGLSLTAYKYVLSDKNLYLGYYNTILMVTLGTAVSLIITALGGYALSRKDIIFRKFFSILIIIPLFFQGGMIPTYLTIKSYHIGPLRLMDSMWAVIALYSVNVFNLIIMRSFFSGISKDLIDAGTMDGLNDFGIFRYIVLPLSKAVMATMSLFYAIDYWNSYFTPFLYINSPKKYPLQIFIRSILDSGGGSSDKDVFAATSVIASDTIKYAYIIVSIIPVIIIYPFIQKYFDKGAMIGSIKG
jgi:ABC-type sugar transport system, permease component